MVIQSLFSTFRQNKIIVTHKDLILGLILKLESEETVLMQDIYRQALEFVVLHTPGDIRF
ncbi:biofilm development regulator YmgB/AriR family protein [Citrobacter amalonaticus]|uniref:biofilm development regulator YmgB/AriR family protein n=1 Tax=Citrobacter amalonaticus TaxID=35703 RepID=UPI00300DA146